MSIGRADLLSDRWRGNVAEALEPSAFPHQLFRQGTRRNHHMNGLFTPEYRSQFLSAKQRRHRYSAGCGPHFCRLACGSVRRQQQQAAFNHSRALSCPATATPARRAKPTVSRQRRVSAAATRSARSAGVVTAARAARANSFFFTAVLTVSRHALNHKPRPGNRSAKSITALPSGPTTNRTRTSLGNVSPLTKQRRVGASLSRAAPHRFASGRCSVVASSSRMGLSFSRAGLNVIGKPMGAGRHDDFIGPLDRQASRRYDFDQFVSG